MARTSPIPADAQAAIVADYARGLSARAVAAAYGIHHSTVIDLVTRCAGTVRKPGRPRKLHKSR
jgi:transposase